MPSRKNRKPRQQPHPEIRTLTHRKIDALVEDLDDPDRVTPVVLISNRSHGAGPVAPPENIASLLPSDVAVWWFKDDEAQWALSGTRDGMYSTYGGAIRVVVRGGMSDDVVITMHDEDAARTPTRVQQAVSKARATLKPPHAPEENPNSGPGSHDDGMWAPRIAELEAAVEQERSERERLTRVVEQVQAAHKEHRRRLDAMEARLSSIDTPPEAVFADPGEQFGHEVQQAWLAQVEPGDRDAWPLREYTLGQDFLDSVDNNGSPLATRPRVVAAAVDVLTRRAYELTGRHVHPQTQGHAGAAVVRDGAMAYRAYISQGPSGPRLVWWELPDGTVELSRVAQHDDYRVR